MLHPRLFFSTCTKAKTTKDKMINPFFPSDLGLCIIIYLTSKIICENAEILNALGKAASSRFTLFTMVASKPNDIAIDQILADTAKSSFQQSNLRYKMFTVGDKAKVCNIERVLMLLLTWCSTIITIVYLHTSRKV